MSEHNCRCHLEGVHVGPCCDGVDSRSDETREAIVRLYANLRELRVFLKIPEEVPYDEMLATMLERFKAITAETVMVTPSAGIVQLFCNGHVFHCHDCRASRFRELEVREGKPRYGCVKCRQVWMGFRTDQAHPLERQPELNPIDP